MTNRVSRMKMRSSLLARTLGARVSPRDPVHVFHHIPKCGGTSINRVLQRWFVPVKDYRSGWESEYPAPKKLSRLRSAHCLCGHFELSGNLLFERYPEVFRSDRFRVFTFVRDPLQLRLSLVSFEDLNNQPSQGTLEERVLSSPNYLAARFGANAENFRERLHPYWFIGVIEEGQVGLDVLGRMAGKHQRQLPWTNQSTGVKTRGGAREVSEEFSETFRKLNALDYQIYDHCNERFRQLRLAAQAADGMSEMKGQA
jgi:hypothetical protein